MVELSSEKETLNMSKSTSIPNPWKSLRDSEWKILLFLFKEKKSCERGIIDWEIGGHTRHSAEGHPNHFDSFRDLSKKGYVVQLEDSIFGTFEITETGRKVVRLGKSAVRQLGLKNVGSQ